MWWLKRYVHRTVPNHQPIPPQETVRAITNPTPDKGELEMLINCRVDYFTTNAHSSQAESQLYTFEDNEAVIKMIMKGRSPTVRHVSRTHTVALGSLFDTINMDPKIQIKYVDTKNQLADMLTKGSFTRDEWDHLLRLLNIMNLSLFSCTHVHSNRKAVCHVQESSGKYTERGVGSCEAESYEFGVKELPDCEEISSARFEWSKQPPQDLSDPNSLVNRRLDQSGVVARSRKLLGDSNQNPTMYSQERQQGDAQASSTWKQERRDESSNSARARKLSARGEDNQFGKSQLHFHNMQISDYRYLEKAFKNLQMGIEALRTNVLIWWVFKSTTMKAAIHMWQNYNENLEVYRDTNFEELHFSILTRRWHCIIKWRFWMWKRLNGHLFHGRDLHFLMEK